jgi:hypothetical protein
VASRHRDLIRLGPALGAVVPSAKLGEGSSAGDRTRAHGKENPPTFYAIRSLDPIRVLSPRQLPTGHDYAVATRGYSSDQPSLLPLALSSALLPPKARLHKNVAWLNLTLDKVAPY